VENLTSIVGTGPTHVGGTKITLFVWSFFLISFTFILFIHT